MANICAAVIRRVRAMDGFAAGGASGCVASATLCVIISFSGAHDASGWAALVWAAVTIGALGAYILVRGLSAAPMEADRSATVAALQSNHKCKQPANDEYFKARRSI